MFIIIYGTNCFRKLQTIFCTINRTVPAATNKLLLNFSFVLLQNCLFLRTGYLIKHQLCTIYRVPKICIRPTNRTRIVILSGTHSFAWRFVSLTQKYLSMQCCCCIFLLLAFNSEKCPRPRDYKKGGGTVNTNMHINKCKFFLCELVVKRSGYISFLWF